MVMTQASRIQRHFIHFNPKSLSHFFPFAAMGTGKSKKEAKHAAAKALIDKLTGSIFLDHPAVYMNVHKPE